MVGRFLLPKIFAAKVAWIQNAKGRGFSMSSLRFRLRLRAALRARGICAAEIREKKLF
jgi:hypothetical protein